MSRDEQSELSRRKYLALAGGAAVSTALAGCSGGGGGGEPTPEGQGTRGGGGGTEGGGGGGGGNESGGGGSQDQFAVTITQGQMDSGLDPQDHRETPTDVIAMQAYEGTLDRDAEGKIIEGLATDWQRMEPGRVRLSLRDGVKFHSGEDLTPEDVAFSLNRIVKENVGGLASPQSDQLAGITGASPAGNNAVDVMSDGVNPIVFDLLASYGDIMQKSWVQEHDTNYINTHANGTGPFKLENYVQDERVVYTRNEDYYEEPAAVSRATFNSASESATRVNQLVSGETDIVVNVPPQEVSRVRSNGNSRVEAVPSTRIIYNGMRYDVEPFSNLQFRRALNLAVDVESIVENILSGFADPTGQPTLEGFVGYNPQVKPYPFNKSRAESLVEESGQAGAQIQLHTPVGRYLKDLEIAQAVAGSIDSLSNVSCSVKQRDFGTLAGELTTGNIEDMPNFYLIGWGNETFDASQTLIPLLTSDGALSSWSNERFDSLVDQSQKESNKQKREQLLRRANKLAHDQAPWIFLNRQYSVYGASNRLQWSPRRDESIKAYSISPQ